jgi:hypothetical protein
LKHPPHEKVATVTLAAGAHRLRIEYFEDTGLAQLAFSLTPAK